MRKISSISILLLVVAMGSVAQEEPEFIIVVENFEDDEATSNGVNKLNTITGINPDEDWYLYQHQVSDCDQGNFARMIVSTSGSQTVGGELISWDSNTLVAASNNAVQTSFCTTNQYDLIFDNPRPVTEFEIEIGLMRTDTTDQGGSISIFGEGQIFATFCWHGTDSLILPSTPTSTCSTSGTPQNFGTVLGHSIVLNLNWVIDWDLQTVTVTITSFELGTPNSGGTVSAVSRTIDFYNPVESMEIIKVRAFDPFQDNAVFTYIDNVAIKDLVLAPEEVVEPVDLETGITNFANEFGFKSTASLKLFAIFFIAGAMIITASVTHFFSDSKYKNWILLAVGVGTATFFILIQFIQLWELTIATVLGGASVQGIREALANVRLPGPVRIPRREGGSNIAEVADVNMPSIGERMESVEAQIRREREERQEREREES